MGKHKMKKYSDKERDELIKEYLENKRKNPNYSANRYIREKGLAESTFRYWLKLADIQNEKNDVVRIETIADNPISEYSCDQKPVIKIKTEKAEMIVENIMPKDILDLFRRLTLNVDWEHKI